MQERQQAIVIGAGPAGLMAAEQLSSADCDVHVYEAMPSVGRKFLRAGVGGLNLTHSEDLQTFCSRYSASAVVSQWLQQLGPQQIRAWAAGLGIETFTGSSGRVFPRHMKASPLLRAWLLRLRQQGVSIHTRHQWVGWEGETAADAGKRCFNFSSPNGSVQKQAEVCVFALGGGSWVRLGSDGHWVRYFRQAEIACADLQPSNCGFDYPWSDHLRERFAGQPLKAVRLSFDALDGQFSHKGEALVSCTGVQGSLIYQASAQLRDRIAKEGAACIFWDLLPSRSCISVKEALLKPRGKESWSNLLRKRLGLTGLKVALLHELAPESLSAELPRELQSELLVSAIKNLPQVLRSARPLDEAISSAGGIYLDELDEHLMLKKYPGVFCAGEMLDWEAPTGGYLLTACLASGAIAGKGAVSHLYSRT